MNMDNFTPPPPQALPQVSSGSIKTTNGFPPPPLPPPPPSDDFGAYSTVTGSSKPGGADTMPGILSSSSSRRVSRDEHTSPATSPDPERAGRTRRGSFGFLSRSKSRSRDVSTVTAPTGRTMLRKQKLRDHEERLRQSREEKPPVLPSHEPLPNLGTTFGSDSNQDLRPDSVAIISGKASNFSRPHQSMLVTSNGKPMQQFSRDRDTMANQIGEYVEPKTRQDSMNIGKHQSYASGIVGNMNSPRRVRRRKDPTPFNILVVGAKNAGKTSFIDFMRTSFASKEKSHPHTSPSKTTSHGSFTAHYLETDVDGERVGLTLWDSQGLERGIVDLQLKEMSTFIEAKFEETFAEEQKVQRTPGSRDTHIHCVFLILDPLRLDVNLRNEQAKQPTTGNAFAANRGPLGLEQELDLQVMKTFSGKTTVIPIISKADTLTVAHMRHLKRAVWNTVIAEKLDPLDALDLEGSDDEFEPDSEDLDGSDSEILPIQGADASSSEDDHYYDSSDLSSSQPGAPSSSRMGPPSSTTTAASPGQPMRRPHSRAASRTMNLPDPSVEDMYIPFSIISPDPYEPEIIGRKFAWGVADPLNAQHCDFVRLRDSVFSEWRAELRSSAREKWYENWRTSRLKRTPQKVRQVGGVTPLASIPKEGRTFSGEQSPPDLRQTSGISG